ncbi:atrial natriuretic peptide-converting enzyme [Drosophila virilis]|uniref:Uncharacterized protein, isoform A n=1 Tax=Drosophila virilis TaxID=7244 RepID=B4LUR3_DROVI|nr:uncharacterized protein LOC6628866 [Drosophila virilis]XP_015028351.1 uncharacterized protein LOC6628866 [Drosophila virilis]XP_015028352.1 uncharacterized protein LOC6628866 [Drosophila virilis]EDW64240.1 uncharacterized protein Dvir_GJ17357, isoform A [Drosophila virilis]KRF81527.1 uncharacterized protein Dvir_GJ17357, isoform B [Drosophila virilis]KRF81528.1 uncharacterized protein Dvir_GJ17357, isoform C [Drosophila virilis]
MDGHKPLEDAAGLANNEASSTAGSVNGNGLRRQPTKYPHGLNITVQTIDDAKADDYSRASTLRSSSSGSDAESCWTDTQKYRIGMLGSPETLAELQVRRYKYPLTANYYLNRAAPSAGQQQHEKPTPLMLLGYARRACRWKYLRWPIIFVASVLLFFGLITYCLWLHDVSVARARFLQRRYEATSSSSTTEWEGLLDEETTEVLAATTANSNVMQESTRLRAIEINREHTTSMSVAEAETPTGDDDYDDVLLPADSIRFTSGHQNSFGVPIEQDKRMLQLLKDLLPKPQSTPPANVHLLTRVSPTLPPPSGVSGRPTEAMTTTPASSIGSGCISTALPMCRGVLDYDLTYNNGNGAPRDAASMEAYEQLISANCSARAVEFVCAALEPECRPLHIGQLSPCRRICKAILEACSIVIANSDQLSELFDCSQYPDAHETHKCEDPTRRRNFCYVNEFQCHDGSCIPQQWQCDNIKDCAGGEDEDEQCLVCDHEEFRCRSNEKCIPENLRCDLNYDCFDASDEEDCDEYGSGDAAPFDEAELNAFPRIFSYASFLSPNETNEKLYTYITATTDEEAGTETKFQVHQVAAPAPAGNASSEEPAAGGGPKGFVNFRDSKEIMMTSDSENKFKYSAQRANRTTSKFSISTATVPTRTASAIPPSALAQQRERERIAISSSSSSTSTTSSTMATPTRAPGRCLPHELRCVSGKCITVDQLCDKQIDCPDAADEIMCVYRERPSVRGLTTTTTMKTTPTTILTTTTAPAIITTTTTTAAPTTTPPMTTTRRSVRTSPNRSRKPKS